VVPVLSVRETRVSLVRDEEGLARLGHSLLGKRETAIVVLTQLEDESRPVLPPGEVRTAVGQEARIYLVCGDHLLRRLRRILGLALMVERGTLRIYWPGLSLRSDPFSHPLIPVLADEPLELSLQELKRGFELTRPYVRGEIKLIEDARTVLQEEVEELKGDLKAMATQLRNASEQRHGAPPRAEAGEQQLRGRA
jgi:hypothetical protein